VITAARLQEERQRVRAAGVRGGRAFDVEAAMAEMRDQGFDPHGQGLVLIFGPAPTLAAGDVRLERFVFRVEGSKPTIEIEVELLPGQIPESEWTPLIARGWVRDRRNPPIPEFYPAGDA
jgi:hypothetical protein